MRQIKQSLLFAVAATSLLVAAAPAPQILVAGQIDPASQGLMLGAPPPPDKQITLGNATAPQNLRWSMRNMQRLLPTARIWRGNSAAKPLPHRLIKLGDLAIPQTMIGPITLSRYLEIAGVDAFVVLHRGKLVHERYYAGMQPHEWHAINSISKSIVGLLVGELIANNEIDPNLQASHYVPELAGSAVGDARIADLLDMLVQYQFGGNEAHTLGLQAAALQAFGTLPRPKDYSGPNGIYDLLRTARSTGPTGQFRYDNGNTETLAWVLQRVTGKDFPSLVSERIWQPIGATSDAMVALDPTGAPNTSGGVIATAMDLARLGELVRNHGRANNRQVLNAAMIKRLFAGGSRAAFAASQNARFLPNHSYHNQWWVRHEGSGAIYARGQYGQTLYIAPADELVIVQLSSYPVPGRIDAPLQFAAYDAIAAMLRAK